jgi:hypothetical protein
MKHNGVVMLVVIAILCLPLYAAADALEVFEIKLKEGCGVEKYQAIVGDFNAYYKDKDYQVELLLPIHADIPEGTVIWVGRSPSNEALGSGLDHYVAEMTKDDSAVSKLQARFEECGSTTSSSSYITVK